jgi:hypothetical protein
MTFYIPFILFCQAGTCSAMGGPLFEERAVCEQIVAEQGVPALLAQHPSAKIIDLGCVAWHPQA